MTIAPLEAVSIVFDTTVVDDGEASEMTQEGRIMGTPAYMSPEQARGRPVDKRTDIWSFGCCLYCALSGRRPFNGETLSDLMAEILKGEPDWDALPRQTPKRIRELMRRCLQKDPKRRLRDIGDAWFEMTEMQSDLTTGAYSISSMTMSEPAPQRRSWALWLVAMVLVIAGTAVTTRYFTTAPAAIMAERRLDIHLSQVPPGAALTHLAIAPDGAQIVYAIEVQGLSQLFVRPVDRIEAHLLKATETGAYAAFFSPTGQWLSYLTPSGTFKKTELSGGPSVSMGQAPANPLGASWSAEEVLICGSKYNGLYRLDAEGGSASQVTKPDRSQGTVGHIYPHVLPGDQAALVTLWTGDPQTTSIAVADLTTGQITPLIEHGAGARYLPSGHVVYGNNGSLFYKTFDLRTLQVNGAAKLVAADVARDALNLTTRFAVAQEGALVYLAGNGRLPDRTLVWVDQAGTIEPLPVPQKAYEHPRLSPDDGKVAVEIWEENHVGIWTIDLKRATTARLTAAGINSRFPVWSADGRKVIFASNRQSQFNLYQKALGAGGQATRMTDAAYAQTPMAVGGIATLSFVQVDPQTNEDIWTLELAEHSQLQALIATPAFEHSPAISPDGKWIAYVSREQGQPGDLVVQAYPGPGPRWVISSDGGAHPVWNPDGSQIFYISPAGDTMMVTDVDTSDTFATSAARVLFQLPFPIRGGFDLSADGKRFLITRPGASESISPRMIYVEHWLHETAESRH